MTVRTCALTIGAVLTLSPAVLADPVSIVTSGFYAVVWDEDSDFRLVGVGFELQGLANSGDNNPLFHCHPCAGGTSLDLSTNFDANRNETFPAVFDGRSYAQVFYIGDMAFQAGSVIAPDLPTPGPGDAAPRADVNAPFVASGFLTAYDNVERAGVPLFSDAFSGRGTATVTFFNSPEFGGIWAERISYQFDDSAPIPEPATLLLIGTGLSAMYMTRRRRRA